MEQKQVYLSLGSNTGNRLYFIEKAKFLINREAGEILEESSVYESPSWGYDDSPYLNTILRISCTINQTDLLKSLQDIEILLGRKSKTVTDSFGNQTYSRRPIDIDILFFDSLIFEHSELIIPHPRLHLRNFILIPFNEIAPEFIHPLLNKKISFLLKNSSDTGILKKLTKNQTSVNL